MAEKGLGGPKGRRFSVDEKLRILEEARSPNTTVAEVLRRYQLDGATFYNWEKQAKAAAAAAMREALSKPSGGRAKGGGASAAERAKDERIARLEAELEKKSRVIAEVVEENLALKKGL